jgi:hypothetical protein
MLHEAEVNVTRVICMQIMLGNSHVDLLLAVNEIHIIHFTSSPHPDPSLTEIRVSTADRCTLTTALIPMMLSKPGLSQTPP